MKKEILISYLQNYIYQLEIGTLTPEQVLRNLFIICHNGGVVEKVGELYKKKIEPI